MRQNYNHRFPLSLAFALLCVMAFPFSALAQETETQQDTTKTGYSLGRIELPRPNSIVASYEYDPVIDRYVYKETLGNFNISAPLILTPEEYEELVMQEEMKNYFQQKIDALSGRKEGTEEEQKDLLPGFYVNSDFFQNIFGGGEIELIPQGSVALDLGILYSKRDNPAFSPRNRRTFTFDFDQRIQLSLLGNIGERLRVTANYDTESTFDFQNQLKLEYTPTEDDIVRKIEVGNINMPLNSALIQGAQSLFGVKTELQFGKTRITGVFSEQKSERRTVNVEGGATVQEFEKFAIEYDENRHFFLAHYFRDHYDEALENYPFINSNVQITRVQVWVTNRSNSVQNLTDSRNIVAIQDLGESPVEGNIGLENPPAGFFNAPPGAYADNTNNDLNPFGITGPQESVLTPAIRDIATVESGFGPLQVAEGTDYVKLENARQLRRTEYTLNSRLGYISLNQRLAGDEILAVAFQYTVGGEVYQVGEFANDGIDASGGTGEAAISQNLVVKLLKSSVTNVNEPVWDLMMKNIYNLGALQLEREDFRMNIVYTDPQPLNYITGVDGVPLPEDVEETTLLKVFNLDNLTINGDPIIGGDGFFDFVPGITVDPQTGNIIFTSVEPFGKYLFDKLDPNPNTGPEDYEFPETYNANQEKYVFSALYNTTKTQAEQLQADKNKFQLRGRYKTSNVEGIPIGAFNVPQGSVTVTAGGRVLQEGVDYVVNYQFGRVQILDEALLASNIPIQVSTENNALFGQQTKRFTGINVEHMFTENFLVGATYLNLNERPLTQKSNYSYEPINNTIFGLNLNYSTEVPFLTRMVNKLPNIDTDVVSNLSLRGEVAYLLPGAPKGNEFDGKATTYIDDFEAAQTSISIDNPLGWELSSVPIGFGGELGNGDLATGYKRAKLAWYSIDPIFYGSSRPDGITDADLSSYATRRVFLDEIFPNVDVVQGQSQVLYTMDLAYYPGIRGPYNYNPSAAGTNELQDPASNFGGITRALNSTNFEQSNVEYIEFWMMDPFIYSENAGNSGGTLVFNLGNISEDVLKDGRKQYENGLPENGGDLNTTETVFGKVPSNQSLIYAFNTEGEQRLNQDIGFDGLSDAEEAAEFGNFANLPDPAADNYSYFLSAEGSILNRYFDYNGIEGNSPPTVTNTDRGNTTLPTVEDINRDNTMNTVDSYFEYEVPLFPGMNIDNSQYITDVKQFNTTLANGQEMPVRWLQFKVPIYEPTEAIGGIGDFRSIRFMRMYLTNFEDPTVLRFGTMDLVRGDYRRYTQTLDPDKSDPANEETSFQVAAVSIEENENRQPIPYVLPPGVDREELMNNNTRIRQNEQSLSLSVCELEPQDARAVYKNFQIDMRQYKNLEMYIHAEALVDRLKWSEGELVAFIRIGTDFTNNFYQIEVPLKPTDFGAASASEIWPEENFLSLPLDLLQEVKAKQIGEPTLDATELKFYSEDLTPVDANTPYEVGDLRIGIKGNPSFGNIRMLMLGVKNGLPEGNSRDLCGEVWFNELRLTDLKNEGGWAAIVNMDANVADFANLSATGRRSTVGFGALEYGPNQRSREDLQQYDVVSNVNMGQLLPKKWGIKIPVSYSIGEELVTPKYDPEFLDLELETVLDNAATPEVREDLKERAESYTKRQSINVIGLRKDRVGESKPMPYDVENLTVSASYNQIDHRDFEIEDAFDQNVRLGATYDYTFAPLSIEPLKNVAVLDSSAYFALLKDINFNVFPSTISASSTIFRQYNEQTFREINLPPGFLNGIPTLYQRNFLFDWQYTINYNFTKSLSLNFNSSTNRIIRNYLDEENRPDTTTDIWDGFFNTGIPNQHFQSLQVNYELPFSKIPVLEFINTTYSYTGNFQWERGSEMFRFLDEIPDLGNSVQNSNSHKINANLEMQTLYDYVGLKKRTAQAAGTTIEERSRNVPTLKPEGAQEEGGEDDNRLSGGDKTYNTFVGLITAIKKIQVNYQENNGIYLPGYTNDIGFLGTWKPTFGFTLGSQEEVRYLAARKGWLTLYQDFNQQYSEVENEQLGINASASLLPDLTIELSAGRMYSETFSENYRVVGGQYMPLTPVTFGNFNISTILLGTAFNESTAESSATFQEFRDNRLEVARRLAVERGFNPNNTDAEGYPVGFGKTSQDVLLPAFLAAYSGKDAGEISLGAFRDFPLPNWNLKYTGFMRIPWFQKKFKRFSVNHGYTAGYTINQFQTNLDYDPENPTDVDQAGNYKSELLYSNVNLTEQFSPLVRIDMEMNNSVKILADVQKDRALSLSFDNNLLTEISGNQYTVGLGYRIKDLKFTTTVGGRQRILSSDLNFKADVSYRHNETIIRYLDVENSQVTAGQDIWAINFTADYALSKNLTALVYYDHSFSEYAISTAFPQTTIRSGITLRYNFGN
ncbi:protein involved in gliding motility SprA [Salinimicrobium catena]|uniref:Protein involved in gliding motility SprA n=2 Tax=Salinimicrobium catena TaxID=390640 RepID=A0A1H5H6Z3_9FLAO|nr:cell surface protein SprA [Salinimicrobium catena]SEE23757.1 protein involved in gliding motility SprA [Salinimicrobium catena]